jgi:hypothetical protein
VSTTSRHDERIKENSSESLSWGGNNEIRSGAFYQELNGESRNAEMLTQRCFPTKWFEKVCFEREVERGRFKMTDLFADNSNAGNARTPNSHVCLLQDNERQEGLDRLEVTMRLIEQSRGRSKR